MQPCFKTIITAYIAINELFLRSNTRVNYYLVNQQVPTQERDSYIASLKGKLHEAQIIHERNVRDMQEHAVTQSRLNNEVNAGTTSIIFMIKFGQSLLRASLRSLRSQGAAWAVAPSMFEQALGFNLNNYSHAVL